MVRVPVENLPAFYYDTQKAIWPDSRKGHEKKEGDNMEKLVDGQLEAVVGGYIRLRFAGEHKGMWEVVNDETDEVMEWYEKLEDAQAAAERLGQSASRIKNG